MYLCVTDNGQVKGFSHGQNSYVSGCTTVEVSDEVYKLAYNSRLNKQIQYENGAITLIDIVVPKTREQKVAEIIVTTSTGKVFDGDEKSQDRMLRAIAIANISGQTTTEWKVADNSVQTITLEELQEALTLAGQEMSRIWMES